MSNINMSIQMAKKTDKTENSINESGSSILAIRQQIKELKNQQKPKQHNK
jgi:hypothetical protein